MKKRSLLTAIMLTLTYAQAENLIVNGDFSEGEYNWYGDDVSVKKMDKNPCLKIKPDSRDELFLGQTFRLEEKPQSYSLRLKYKTSSDYSGEGINFRLMATEIYTEGMPKHLRECQRTFKLQATEEWVPINWNINFKQDMSPCAKIQLQLHVLPGDGEFYLDDIECIGSDTLLEPTPWSPPPPPAIDPDNATYTRNLLKNGSFKKGNKEWRFLPANTWELHRNNVIAKARNDRRYNSSGFIDQSNIQVDECRNFRIRGKYKTSEKYEGEGFQTLISTQSRDPKKNAVYADTDNTNYTKRKTFPIQSVTEWTEFQCTLSLPKTDRIKFTLFVLYGSGEIHFSDLELAGIR